MGRMARGTERVCTSLRRAKHGTTVPMQTIRSTVKVHSTTQMAQSTKVLEQRTSGPARALTRTQMATRTRVDGPWTRVTGLVSTRTQTRAQNMKGRGAMANGTGMANSSTKHISTKVTLQTTKH